MGSWVTQGQIKWFTVDRGTGGNQASMHTNFRDDEVERILDGIVGSCLRMIALARKEVVTKLIKRFGTGTSRLRARVDGEAQFMAEHESEIRGWEVLIMTVM